MNQQLVDWMFEDRRTQHIRRSLSFHATVLSLIHLIGLLVRHLEGREMQRRRHQLSILLLRPCFRKVLLLRFKSSVSIGFRVAMKATACPIHGKDENGNTTEKDKEIKVGNEYSCKLRETDSIITRSPWKFSQVEELGGKTFLPS